MWLPRPPTMHYKHMGTRTLPTTTKGHKAPKDVLKGQISTDHCFDDYSNIFLKIAKPRYYGLHVDGPNTLQSSYYANSLIHSIFPKAKFDE